MIERKGLGITTFFLIFVICKSLTCLIIWSQFQINITEIIFPLSQSIFFLASFFWFICAANCAKPAKSQISCKYVGHFTDDVINVLKNWIIG